MILEECTKKLNNLSGIKYSRDFKCPWMEKDKSCKVCY
jgi:hypothetical protein